MPDLVLTPREQAAVSLLVRAEPVEGRALPDRTVLVLLARLVACDALRVERHDLDGALLAFVSLPGRPARRETAPADSLHLAFRADDGHAVDVWLDRVHRPFRERDATLLRLVAPALHRLVRLRCAPGDTGGLTEAEWRVLALVATGLSNADIAARLSVTTSTVRKHLEHCYRKLGVSNRMGAVAAGGILTGPQPARIGMRTPRSAATSTARS